MANPLLVPLLGWLGRLSHPRLFTIAAVLFGVNLLIPDPIPFIDELLLGLATLLLASRKSKTPPRSEPLDGRATRS